MNVCGIQGCEKQVKAHGLCGMHAARVSRHGSPFYESRNKNGNGTTNKISGYRLVSINGKQIREHVLVAEKALGKKLPKGAIVHHVNGVRDDNRTENLVICPDTAYHKLIHKRQNALDSAGNADYEKCPFCKTYDKKEAMQKRTRGFCHASCANQYKRSLRNKNAKII